MSAHTAGPWRIGSGACHTVYGHAAGEARTCDPIVAHCYSTGSSSVDLANARLIAAAPELYALLVECIQADDDQPIHHSLRRDAEDLIAKAEGRS